MPTVLKRCDFVCDFVFVFVFLVFFCSVFVFLGGGGGGGEERVDCSISPHHCEAEISI